MKKFDVITIGGSASGLVASMTEKQTIKTKDFF